MKVMFPVTFILLCALAKQATAFGGGHIRPNCPKCDISAATAATNCKYGLDYGNILPQRRIGGCPLCGPVYACADRPKKLPPNTFPSRDFVDLSRKCKQKLKSMKCRSCTWGKVYMNENDCCGSCLEPTKDTLYANDQTFDEQYDGEAFDEQYDGARGADTVTLHDSNVHVPLHLAAAVLKLNLKVGTSVTGIPLSKFRKFMNFALYVETSHQINVGFDAKSETHVGLGVATVNDKCNNKMQIVVIAKRSSNSQKLKAALERQLKSKMDPLKGCSRSLRGY